MGLPRGLQGSRRSDGIDLADESWQPSKLELQARLGASKERQLELEWRLQQAEQKIAQAQVNMQRLLPLMSSRDPRVNACLSHNVQMTSSKQKKMWLQHQNLHSCNNLVSCVQGSQCNSTSGCVCVRCIANAHANLSK